MNRSPGRCTEWFSHEGARVVVNYLSSREEGEQVVADIKAAGGDEPASEVPHVVPVEVVVEM